MRKPVFPRIIILLLVYFLIFTTLVALQFAKQRAFTRKAGNMVVTWQSRAPGENDELLPNEYLLEGDVHILFGGIDFTIGKGID